MNVIIINFKGEILQETITRPISQIKENNNHGSIIDKIFQNQSSIKGILNLNLILFQTNMKIIIEGGAGVSGVEEEAEETFISSHNRYNIKREAEEEEEGEVEELI